MIAATLEQKEQFAKIQQQEERQTQEQWRRRYDRMLAVLSPRQQEKLRAEIQRAEDAEARPAWAQWRFQAGRSKMAVRSKTRFRRSRATLMDTAGEFRPTGS